MNCPWVEVLVDAAGAGDRLYTYGIPQGLRVEPGDILTVPFGSHQTVGAIAVRNLHELPSALGEIEIKPVQGVVKKRFFTPTYNQLLQQTAAYYACDLVNVLRLALPPGVLQRSQRRYCLNLGAIPPGAEVFLVGPALELFNLLQGNRTEGYTLKYLQTKVRAANKGLRELSDRGWVAIHWELKKTVQAQTQKVAVYVEMGEELAQEDLTPRQREVWRTLKHQGGELAVTELVKLAKTSNNLLENLASKGYIVVEDREKLRFLVGGESERDRPKSLTPAQQQALNRINQLTGAQTVLLHGVTGSGKTEIYLQAIEEILRQGRSAMVLVPEIGLTPQLSDRFQARFGAGVFTYHSGLSVGERYDTWRQVLTPEPQVIIGTRSAVFLPCPNLGLIILDEEHDSSFKQDEPAPSYHARTVAQWRSQLEQIPLLLGSATPALESWVASHHYPHHHYLSLPDRVYNQPLPPVQIIDLRDELKSGNRSLFSRSLRQALLQLEDDGSKAILFVPRRGHSTFVSCRSCGEVLECPHCDVSLSYHYTHEGAAQLLRCHYCNHTKAQPKLCPSCGSPYLKFFGSGTQKVIQALAKEFSQLKALRFDSDTTRHKEGHRQLLTQFAQEDIDLLVGTQMLTKGIDLPQVRLVAVLAADGLLFQSNYRSTERAFQTLTQVAGRAGRDETPGQVLIQTYNPEHPVIEAVKTHNYQQFIDQELPQRQELNYPPYGKLILFKLTSPSPIAVEKTAHHLASVCLDRLGDWCEILGPAPAQVMRVKDQFRWQLLLKFSAEVSDRLGDLNQFAQLCPHNVRLAIDVDPLQMA